MTLRKTILRKTGRSDRASVGVPGCRGAGEQSSSHWGNWNTSNQKKKKKKDFKTLFLLKLLYVIIPGASACLKA